MHKHREPKMAGKAAQWQAQHEHYGPAGYGLDEQGGAQQGPSSLGHHPQHPAQPYERQSCVFPSPLVRDASGVIRVGECALTRVEPLPAAYGHAAAPHESKRDKRRREMVDRVSRLNEDTIARRDRSVCKFALDALRF